MDWMNGLNRVMGYIEENLTEPLDREILARMVGCSIYEFSKVFSYLTGMSVSEYIRRRRLSQAVFDLQGGREKIVDIALKYGYESPAAFTRAFKELHGTTPQSARGTGIALKTYPPMSFSLTMTGAHSLNFRIEKREVFQIAGLAGCDEDCPAGDCQADDSQAGDSQAGDCLTPLWRTFMENYNTSFWNGGGADSYYTAPFWQVGAYWFEPVNGKIKTMIGAEYKGRKPEGTTVETIPAATWAVFSFTSPTGIKYVPAAYTKIMTEWFPASRYQRDERTPSLEVFPGGNAADEGYVWEIWMPVKAS